MVITVDVARHRQRMWIMNVVWPVTTLYAGPLALLAYYRIGRLSAAKETAHKRKPFWQSVAVGATHCGSGCALGDLLAEWLVVALPIELFGQRIFGTWALDFGFAFVLGIAFQYFSIAPMRGLGLREGLMAALKADTLSLIAWQVGMYGWMGIVHFVLLGELAKTEPVFWFMMQIAMLFGFATAFPVNWWLIRAGVKEEM